MHTNKVYVHACMHTYTLTHSFFPQPQIATAAQNWSEEQGSQSCTVWNQTTPNWQNHRKGRGDTLSTGKWFTLLFPGKSEVPDIISQKEFSDKVIDKKWIYLKTHSTDKE